MYLVFYKLWGIITAFVFYDLDTLKTIAVFYLY